MENDHSTDAPMTSKFMRRFVECVDDGDVRRELGEDCILNIFARCVKGVADVTGYLRTQITGRYKHVDFANANLCDASQEVLLNNRYGRSFEVLRRRLKMKKSTIVATMCNLRAESDDDDAGKCPSQLATPPRSGSPVQNSEKIQYIESIGMLEALHEHNDGGISLEDSCKVKLTLGYRCDILKYNTDWAPDICLVLYEKFLLPATTRTLGTQRPRTRCLRYVHTDDEGEEPTPRSVRRTLFATADSEDPDESLGSILTDVDNSPKPALTPRKRQHKKDQYKNSKRSMRF